MTIRVHDRFLWRLDFQLLLRMVNFQLIHDFSRASRTWNRKPATSWTHSAWHLLLHHDLLQYFRSNRPATCLCQHLVISAGNEWNAMVNYITLTDRCRYSLHSGWTYLDKLASVPWVDPVISRRCCDKDWGIVGIRINILTGREWQIFRFNFFSKCNFLFHLLW